MHGGIGARIESLLARWVDLCVRRARWVLVAALAASVAAGAFTVARFQVDTDRSALLSADLPFQRESQRVDRLFPQFADDLVLVVDAPTPERARAAALALGGELRARGELFRDAYVPRADPFLERHGLLFRSPEELRKLADRLARVQPFLGRLTHDPSLRGMSAVLAQAVAARAQGRAVELGAMPSKMRDALEAALSGDRRELSWQELMAGESPTFDARRQFVLAEPVLDYGRVLAGAPAIDAVRAIVEGDEFEGVQVRITGGLALSTEELSSVLLGSERIAILVLVLVGAILWFALRSWVQVASVLAVLVAGLALTAAAALATVSHFNMISIAFAALYLGLGVDYAIHYALRWRELVTEGEPRAAALSRAARDVGGSLALCALTTAIGFFSFVPTAYAGVSELGLISGIGMFVSLVATLTLLPALFALRGGRGAVPPPPFSSRQGVQRWLGLPVRHAQAVVALAALLGLAALALVPKLRFDPNPLALRRADSESVETFRELLATSETPPWSATVLADGPEAARAEAERLGALDVVDAVVWLGSFVPAEQDEKLAELEELALVLGPELELASDAERPSIAEERAAVLELARSIREAGDAASDDERGLAETLERFAAELESSRAASLVELAETNLFATLPQSLALLRDALDAGPVALDSLPAELAARWRSPDGTLRLEAFPRAGLDLESQADLERFVTAVQSVAPAAVGPPILMLESGRAVVGAFRQALATAFVAIALLVLVVLRSFVDALLVLAPLLLASLLSAATMVALGMPFNFANVIALPLLLGIGVDSGIHVVHTARRAAGVNPLTSSAARGVLYSALTTAVSFANLAFSAHPGTASLGATLTIAILWTLACALVVLPALLAHPLRSARGT